MNEGIVVLRDHVSFRDVRQLADGHGWSFTGDVPRSRFVLASHRWQTADGSEVTYTEDHTGDVRYIRVDGPDREGLARFIAEALPSWSQTELLVQAEQATEPLPCIQVLSRLAVCRPLPPHKRYIAIWQWMLKHRTRAVRRAAIRTAYDCHWPEMIEVLHERLAIESELVTQLQDLLDHLESNLEAAG